MSRFLETDWFAVFEADASTNCCNQVEEMTALGADVCARWTYPMRAKTKSLSCNTLQKYVICNEDFFAV